MSTRQRKSVSSQKKADAHSLGSHRSDLLDVREDVRLGVSFQINNIFDIDESGSRFSLELIVNMTWVDPGLALALADGSLKKELSEHDQWADFQVGWQFRDFVSPCFADINKHESARVLNDVLEHKPQPWWLNEIEKITIVEDPVTLQNRRTGRVGYSVTVKSVFDEVFELHHFPFDDQVFDVRVAFEPTDKHRWILENNPREINGWYGKWSRNKHGDIIEHPEWVFSRHLDDHMDFSSTNGYPIYHMRVFGKRRSGYYALNALFIAFVIVALGLPIFFMPVDTFAERLGHMMTLLLTLVAFKLVIADKLPKVAYLTTLDKYMLLGICLLVLIAIESTTMFGIYVNNRGEIAEQHVDQAVMYDRYAMYIYAGIWALAQAWVGLEARPNTNSFHKQTLHETGWAVLHNGKKVVLSGGDDGNRPKTLEYRNQAGTNSPMVTQTVV